jgi:hypothetical protein
VIEQIVLCLIHTGKHTGTWIFTPDAVLIRESSSSFTKSFI